MLVKNKIDIKNFWQPGLLIIALLVSIVLSFFYQSKLSDEIEHTWILKSNLYEISNSLKNAETGQRGFLLSKKTEYLEPYHKGEYEYKIFSDDLKDLISDNQFQVRNAQRLDSLTKQLFANLEFSIKMVENDQDSLMKEAISIGRGKMLMDEIRYLINDMQTEEINLLNARLESYNNWRKTTYIFILIAALLTIYFLKRLYNFVLPLFEDLENARKALHNSNLNMSETISVLKLEFNEKEIELKKKEDELIMIKEKLKKMDNNIN